METKKPHILGFDPNIKKIDWTSAGERIRSLLLNLYVQQPAVMSLLSDTIADY